MHEPSNEPLLLHSLSEFRELILSCLDLIGARSVVEVGSEDGAFTRDLVAWAEGCGGTVYAVDPAPAPALTDLAASSPRLELVLARSLEVLSRLEACDAYFIDGDHNYFTVTRELQAIDARSAAGGRHPVVFVHDVGWPAGRRDMYYSPESIPAEHLRPHSYENGAVLGRSDLVPGGFRGEGQFAWASEEGGPANGVLTAVEDFRAERPDVVMATVPAVFGLGVVWHRSAPYADALDGHLSRYDGDVLLRRLERNRLALYLEVLRFQDEHVRLHAGLESAALRNRDVEVENRALWARTAELEDQVKSASERHEKLVTAVRALMRSRAIELAERLSGLNGRLHGRPVHTYEAVRSLLDGGT